jgi:hypothetical protein
MEKAPIPDPCTVLEPSTVTDEQIQAQADSRLLRPKMQVGWRPTIGQEFLTEGTGETVIFLAHIECGFGIPAGHFLRDHLYFYRTELVHLVPNLIAIIATFIHLCKAYLGIALPFHL